MRSDSWSIAGVLLCLGFMLTGCETTQAPLFTSNIPSITSASYGNLLPEITVQMSSATAHAVFPIFDNGQKAAKEDRTDDALQFFDQVIQLLQARKSNPKLSALFQYHEGMALLFASRYAEAVERFRVSQETFTAAGDTVSSTDALFGLAFSLAHSASHDAGEAEAQQALSLTESRHDDAATIGALRLIARVFYVHNQPADVAKYLSRLTVVAQQAHTDSLPEDLDMLIEALVKLQDYTQAKIYLKQAIELPLNGPWSKSLYHEQLGGILYHEGDLDGAQSHYEQARAVRHELYGDDDSRTVEAAAWVGAVEYERHHMTEARAILFAVSRAYDQHPEWTDRVALATVNYYLGTLLLSENNFPEATQRLQVSWDERVARFGGSSDTVKAGYALATALCLQGREEEAHQIVGLAFKYLGAFNAAPELDQKVEALRDKVVNGGCRARHVH